MTRMLTAYLSTLLAFLALDALWFATVIEVLYRPELEALLLTEFRVLPGLVFYVVYVTAVVVLAVRPFEQQQSSTKSALLGFLLGLAAYGAYDLTNLATLRGWSEIVTVVDWLWGACLTAAAAFAGSFTVQRFFAKPIA